MFRNIYFVICAQAVNMLKQKTRLSENLDKPNTYHDRKQLVDILKQKPVYQKMWTNHACVMTGCNMTPFPVFHIDYSSPRTQSLMLAFLNMT